MKVSATKSSAIGKSEDLLRQAAALAGHAAGELPPAPPLPERARYAVEAALALMREGFHDYAEAILDDLGGEACRPALIDLRLQTHGEARAKLQALAARGVAG